jgi:hypothetical protein
MLNMAPGTIGGGVGAIMPAEMAPGIIGVGAGNGNIAIGTVTTMTAIGMMCVTTMITTIVNLSGGNREGAQPMRIILATMLCLVAGSAFAADVTFTCELQGSGSKGPDGFEITAVNSTGQTKKCSATCNITLGDGSTKDYKYTDQSVSSSPNKQYFAGESALSGAPVSNPKITSSSCN